jgi:F-type H+-transporting ATPase subunit b
LGVIPGLAVVWVIIFVLLLSVVLDRWLFTPVTRVMRERETTVKSALALAEESAGKASKATAEVDRQVGEVQSNLYREMDVRRRAALERRGELLVKTRQEVEAFMTDATSRLNTQAVETGARLEKDADQLGLAIVERVLERKAS